MYFLSDPHPPYHGVNTSTEDLATRIRNLDVLLHNIKAFYEVRFKFILNIFSVCFKFHLDYLQYNNYIVNTLCYKEKDCIIHCSD